jgi:hypothetical protein
MLLRLPQLMQDTPETVDLLGVGVRVLSFGLLGIVCGELFSRLKYNLARVDGGPALDEWSRVYNQHYLHYTLAQARSRHSRYRESLSVVVVVVSAPVLADLRPQQQRLLVRGVAEQIRSNVRMVDEVCRLDDGRFVIVLPHTGRAGGVTVRDRLTAVVRDALGARPEAVAARLLSLPEDAEALDAFVDSIAPLEPDYASSGAYSSSAASTLNPAEASASAAPAASTLKTSTAATPAGSTKQ